jgi:hypothetical protein
MTWRRAGDGCTPSKTSMAAPRAAAFSGEREVPITRSKRDPNSAMVNRAQ